MVDSDSDSSESLGPFPKRGRVETPQQQRAYQRQQQMDQEEGDDRLTYSPGWPSGPNDGWGSNSGFGTGLVGFGTGSVQQQQPNKCGRKFPQVCVVCKQEGHMRVDCPVAKSTLCNGCRELGHIVRYCPKRHESTSQAAYPPPTYNLEPPPYHMNQAPCVGCTSLKKQLDAEKEKSAKLEAVGMKAIENAEIWEEEKKVAEAFLQSAVEETKKAAEDVKKAEAEVAKKLAEEEEKKLAEQKQRTWAEGAIKKIKKFKEEMKKAEEERKGMEKKMEEAKKLLTEAMEKLKLEEEEKTED